MEFRSLAFCAIICGGIGATATFLVISGGHVQADCQDEPCDVPPCCNGDTNGDGSLDLSDVIYQLLYMFGGGPEPRPLPVTPDPVCLLPATGQTSCWDAGGVEVDCETGTCAGQDGQYQAGSPTEGRFVNNGDGTITDTCTGLVWQRQTSAEKLTWSAALEYCENLSLGGHDNWRLPNIRELQSIIDYGRSAPAADPIFITVSAFYWSSTTNVSDPTQGWITATTAGQVSLVTKEFPCYVRAVSGGLTPPP